MKKFFRIIFGLILVVLGGMSFYTCIITFNLGDYHWVELSIVSVLLFTSGLAIICGVKISEAITDLISGL